MLYRNIHKDLLEKILKKVSEMELKIIVKEGTLLDNYLIHNINNSNKAMTLGNGKPHKYILIVEVYNNEWSSRYDMITTDSYHRVKKYFNEDEIWEAENE